jgi:hypothetical protein
MEKQEKVLEEYKSQMNKQEQELKELKAIVASVFKAKLTDLQ